MVSNLLLLSLLYLKCSFRQVDRWYLLKVIEDRQYLGYIWSLLGVRNQTKADEVFHFFRYHDAGVLRKVVGSLANGELLTFHEGMLSKAQSICNTAKHPYICLGADIKTTIFVDHLRRPVHHSRIALIWLKNFVYSILVLPLVNQCCGACWTKVTEFEFFVM